jgi:hypothetical protein
MLEFTQHADKPTLRLLVLHDDAEREFDYTAGAEAGTRASTHRPLTIVSIKNDWTHRLLILSPTCGNGAPRPTRSNLDRRCAPG